MGQGYTRNRKVKPVTPERLHNAAIAYMGRFSTTAENLRRVLLRRVTQAENLEPAAKAALKAHIDTLIEKYQTMGYLNDAAYVEGKVVSLRRAGTSTRIIAQKLRAKGADPQEVETVLEADEATDEDAAWIFARRKRLGPFRTAEARAEKRQKDMAAMGRAGFDYQTARSVIDAPPAETDE